MNVALVCSSGGAISRNSTAFAMIRTAVSGPQSVARRVQNEEERESGRGVHRAPVSGGEALPSVRQLGGREGAPQQEQ
jgi:hypothetical protein